jgi:hypothetical protein
MKKSISLYDTTDNTKSRRDLILYLGSYTLEERQEIRWRSTALEAAVKELAIQMTIK